MATILLGQRHLGQRHFGQSDISAKVTFLPKTIWPNLLEKWCFGQRHFHQIFFQFFFHCYPIYPKNQRKNFGPKCLWPKRHSYSIVGHNVALAETSLWPKRNFGPIVSGQNVFVPKVSAPKIPRPKCLWPKCETVDKITHCIHL